MAGQILDSDGKPMSRDAAKELLTTEQATPTLTGVRSMLSDHPSAGLTPHRLANLLADAENGDTTAYLELAEDMEEKDAHYASVLSTRKLQLVGRAITITAASEDAGDVKIADFVRDYVKSPALSLVLPDILDSFGKGYSVCEIIWQTGQQWLPREIKHRDPRWFRFDRQTDELGLVLDAVNTAPLVSGKFITHIFKRKSGRPIRGGLARAATWYYLFKNLDLKGWVQFADRYGQPFRVGKYGAGATDADKKALLRAVRNIAQDAAAIIPQSMEIEFIEAKMTGTVDLYEKLAEWTDRQISKLVLGQTGTTDVGQHVGTANAHEKVRDDIADYDARMLAATINRDLVRPMVDINFGPQQHYPVCSLDAPDAEDMAALVKNVNTLVRLGMRVSEQEMHERMGLREPQKDERVLSPVAPTQEPTEPEDEGQEAASALRGCPVHGIAAATTDVAAQTDALDDLAALALEDWEPQAKGLIDPVRELVAECNSLEELQRRLPELAGKLDTAALTEKLARAMFNARLAGEVGADLVDIKRG